MTRRQIAAGGAHVLELLLEERVALLQLVELLERERVDRTEQAQLAIELADAPGRRRALGQLGLLGGLGDRGLDVEVATQCLDRVLEAQLGLGLVDLGAMGPLRGVSSSAARRRARALRAASSPAVERPHLVALAAALLDRACRARPRSPRGGRRRARRAARSASSDRSISLAGDSAARCPRLGVGLEPALGLVDALLEELLALVQTGVADLELAAPGREHRGARLELGPRLAAARGGLGLGLLVGVERREHGLELGDPLALDVDVVDQVATAVRSSALELGLQLAPFARARGPAPRRRR